MPAIEIRIAFIAPEIEWIAGGVGKRSQRDVRNRMSPGVGCLKCELVTEAPVEPQLQCVIAGVTVRLVGLDVTEIAVQTIIGNQHAGIVSLAVVWTDDTQRCARNLKPGRIATA